MADTPTSDSFTGMVFDLSPIEPSRRFEFWHDVGSLIQRPVLTEAIAANTLYVRAELTLFDEIVSGQMTASAQAFERTSKMIRFDHIDNFLLTLVESGSVVYSSKSREYHAQPGDLLLIDQGESSCSQWSAHSQIYAAIPRMLLTRIGNMSAGTQVLRSGSGRALILGQYLRSFWNLHKTQTLEENLRLVKGLVYLTHLYFGDSDTRADSTIESEHRQSMVDTIKHWVNSQLHRRDLSPEEICERFHVSRSTLYTLFQPDGGVRNYVQTLRLTKALHILESTDSHIAISTIAKQLGFSSLSSFTRAFSNHWGLSPREARKRADSHRQSSRPRMPQPQKDSMINLKEKSTKYYNALQASNNPS
jgi:AraC-like DNA-binding protein